MKIFVFCLFCIVHNFLFSYCGAFYVRPNKDHMLVIDKSRSLELIGIEKTIGIHQADLNPAICEIITCVSPANCLSSKFNVYLV